MERIEMKSTGQLIDEMITAQLKVIAVLNDENSTRFWKLHNVVYRRVGERWDLVDYHRIELENVLQQCWKAQDIVAKYKTLDCSTAPLNQLRELAEAGLEAQRTNAIRCKLVREIDEILGEADRTYLEKTYG